MVSGFDLAATTYDADFTHSEVGKLQRNRVRHYLEKHALTKDLLAILELNCGTGEDAQWLAKKGHHVLATDLSENMLAVARLKKESLEQLRFEILDLKDLGNFYQDQQFHLLFSNFGGLNCLNPQELADFLNAAGSKLSPKGKLALVLMPKKCLWERFFYLVKGDTKKAYRRNTSDGLKVTVEGQKVTTWYYNPSDLKKIIAPQFKTLAVKPIGFASPPSYLEAFFKKRKTTLSFLGWLDRWLDRISWLSSYADHFILIAEKR